MSFLTNKVIFLFILLVALFLRGFNYFEIPFTHDEFSALFRINFDTFSELIEKGVKTTDTHPAGIQVLLYFWTKLFGTAEWVVKLPFLIFGVLSVLLIYLIAKRWYNESVALIVTAFFSSIQYMVAYGQLARPYVSGLFFVLLMVYYWTKIIKNPQHQFYKNALFFVLAASLCTYNHYFSLLFAVIVGISGLFFLPKKYLLPYFLCGVFIFLLFIPHLNIFFHQLSQGGIEGWLGKPNKKFIINFFQYVFQFSPIAYLIVLGVILFGWRYNNTKKIFLTPSLILFLSWFLLPLIIGFLYSKYVNAVLQYSGLIFSFPFILFVLFGKIKELPVKFNFIIVILILSVNVFSLVAERNHYTLFYESWYEEVITDCQTAQNQHTKTIAIIEASDDKKIIDYYLKKHDLTDPFIWLNSLGNEKQINDFLIKKSQTYDYLYLGGISSISPLIIPLIQRYFPTIAWQKNYLGGTTYLFSKKKEKENKIIAFQGFETDPSPDWKSLEKSKYIDSISFSGKNAYSIDSTMEFASTYSQPLKNIIQNKNNFIDISLSVKGNYNPKEIVLVAVLLSKGESFYWSGTSLDKFISEPKNDHWHITHHSIKLSDVPLNHRDIEVRIYLWNPKKQSFLIDDFKIKLRDGNPLIYGFLEEI